MANKVKNPKSKTCTEQSRSIQNPKSPILIVEDAEEALQYRLDLERLVSSISANFINCPVEEIEKGINHALKSSAEFVGAVLSSVFLFYDDLTMAANTHEWCAAPVDSQIDLLREIPFAQFGSYAATLKCLDTVVIGRLADIPPDAHGEREWIKVHGFRPLLFVPMIFEGSLYGTLGFYGQVGQERDWPEDFVVLLKFVADILVNALERKRAQETLQQTEEKYRNIFENAAVGIFQTTPGGRFLSANSALSRLLGYESPEELMTSVTDIGRQDYIDPSHRANCMCLLEEQDEVYGFEVQARCKDGSVIWVLENARTVRDENGTLLYYEGALQDITDRKRAEEALWESNRLLQETLVELEATQEQILQQERMAAVGQLAAGIAHDFNNILTSILGFAELLQRRSDMPESARSDLDRVLEQGQRAAHLVRQILDFSRKSVHQPQQIDMTPFLKETVKFLEHTIPENIHILLEIEPGQYWVNADLTQLQQVVTNLAVNARDAMPAGGELKLRLSSFTLQPNEPPPCPEMPPGKWAALSAADTGTGIPDETLLRILEPFFTTKEVGLGTGLGLAQVYGIVRQHEGYLDVESQEGKGTTFTVYLPTLTAKDQASKAEASAEMFRGHGETVLLVEDGPAVLATGKAMLEHLNYRVLAAANGQEALTVYAEHQDEIALVLTDMVMPKMDGIDLFESLQTQNPAVKVVMMTGYPLKDHALKALTEEVVDWLLKPIEIRQLAQVVSLALR